MNSLHQNTNDITKIVEAAAVKARQETSNEPEPHLTQKVTWPVNATVGPGLEGAIACESKIGYVNGAKGWLIYRGYDIFDLCAYSTFEEVSYLLLHGHLPNAQELADYNAYLRTYRSGRRTMRMMMGTPVEQFNTMEGLRLGVMFARDIRSNPDAETAEHDYIIGSDEDSIPMETEPRGEKEAIYRTRKPRKGARSVSPELLECYGLIGVLGTIAAGVSRLHEGHLPIEPREDLSHAGNLLYGMTGRVPTPVEERVMDIALILHADHGMNASTFASMVVASTLSDIYFSVGAGIGALHGSLHGGANEAVLHQLHAIGSPAKVPAWFKGAMARNEKMMGFGHRVYKAYDPRARVLGPLARYLTEASQSKESMRLLKTAEALEKRVVSTLGAEKHIFPNVDFYSGIVYDALGIHARMFTPLFAVSRVSGWTARVMEYLEHNRIFRPRAIYTGDFDKTFVPVDKR